MIARTQGDVQLPDWCKGVRLLCTKGARQRDSGTQFPQEALVESSSRYLSSNRVAVSQRDPSGKLRPRIRARNGIPFPKQASCGKCIPEFPLETGCAFPVEGLWETASHLEGQNWDAVSGPGIKTKLRWNSSCLGLQPAKTRTISPQLMRAGKMPALATKCHLRGLGGHSQRHVTETHIGYGMPSSTDKRCPAGLPSNEACHSLRRSARCRQSADTAK